MVYGFGSLRVEEGGQSAPWCVSMSGVRMSVTSTWQLTAFLTFYTTLAPRGFAVIYKHSNTSDIRVKRAGHTGSAPKTRESGW